MFSSKSAFSVAAWAFAATQTTHSSAGRTNHENFLSNRNKTQTTNGKTTRYATKLKRNFSSFANKFSNLTVWGECSTRRQALIFSQKLEHDNKSSIHFGNSTRLQTRPCRNTFLSIYAQTSAFFQKRNRPSPQRNSRFACQKCHVSDATHPRTVYQYCVCHAKKGRRNKVCNKSKGSEPVSELPPFQNGGHSLALRSVTAQRLDGKNRPERRLFCDSHMGKSPVIPTVSLERLLDGICISHLA